MRREKIAWKLMAWPLLCALLGLLLGLPSPVKAADAAVTVATWDELAAAVNGTATNIVVRGTLEADSKIEINREGVTLSSQDGRGEIVYKSDYNGNLFAIPAGGSLTLTEITLDGKQVEKSRSLITINGGQLTLGSGGKLCNHKVTQSGSVVSLQGGTFTMTGGEISGNSATLSNGGGVYINGGTFTMTGGVIQNNTARDHGGAVYMWTGAINLHDGQILNNTAELGGGIYMNSGTVNMTGGQISNNAARKYGGGVYNNGGMHTDFESVFTLNGGQILDNKADLFGGGAFICSDGVFNLQNGQISRNAAPSGGGAYVWDGGAFVMTGGQVSKNTAADNGGGILATTDSSFTMTGGKITGNQATGSGGGVYARQNIVFTLEDGQISENTAVSGGGVIVSDTTFTMTGGKITGNQATGSGGGVYAWEGKFVLEGGQISANKAEKYGKGVYVHSNCAFTASGAPVVGGAGEDNGVYLSPGKTIGIAGGLQPGGWINLEEIKAAAEGLVVADDPAGASGDQAKYFRYLPGGYSIWPQGAQYVLMPPRHITVSYGAHGSVSPSGRVEVAHGGSQTFTFTPESGFVVEEVLVDRAPVAPSGKSYTLTQVTKDLELRVTFVRGIVVSANPTDARPDAPAPEETPGSPQQPSGEPSRWYQALTTVNLRGGPGAHYEKLGTLAAGQTAEVLDIVDGWAKVSYGDGIAYVAAQFLVPASGEGPAQGLYTVTARTLNVRAGAGTTQAIVGKLRRGDPVEVLEAAGGWCKIRHAGGTAYVSAKYVTNVT